MDKNHACYVNNLAGSSGTNTVTITVTAIDAAGEGLSDPQGSAVLEGSVPKSVRTVAVTIQAAHLFKYFKTFNTKFIEYNTGKNI